MARERTDITPALISSMLLHGGLAAVALITWPFMGKTLPMGAVVPVTIVSEAPVANVRAAAQALEEQLAQTEEMVEDAPPEPVAPVAEPIPAPAPAKSTPKPADKPAPKPKPAAQAKPGLDLDALAASLAKVAKPSGQRRSGAQRGPARAETAVEARPAVGAATALEANALSSLAADLARRWNPNCEVEGGSAVDIRVSFRLGPAGRLIGLPESSGDDASDPVVKAASDRAKRAVHQAAPFEDLPQGLYGERIVVRFNARQACG